jgi:hypothetical protein
MQDQLIKKTEVFFVLIVQSGSNWSSHYTELYTKCKCSIACFHSKFIWDKINNVNNNVATIQGNFLSWTLTFFFSFLERGKKQQTFIWKYVQFEKLLSIEDRRKDIG